MTLKSVSPRGLSLLHGLQSQARSQTNELISILIKTEVDKPAASFLVDDSFGWDEPFLLSVIQRLSEGGRRLHLELYFMNGPSMRKYRTTPVRGFCTRMSPGDFRSKIFSDKRLRRDYTAIVTRSVGAIKLCLSLGGTVALCPMLEDNLTDKAFIELLSLSKKALPDDLLPSVRWLRNPCRSCYPGNQDGTPRGVLLEKHAIAPNSVRKGIVSNDGTTYTFNDETGVDYSPKVKLKELRRLRDFCSDKGNWFILWSAKYQGKHGGGQVAPAKRNYTMPTGKESRELIDFLRS